MIGIKEGKKDSEGFIILVILLFIYLNCELVFTWQQW
jgi:hypothetical protein